jgi:hypothetical protein
MRDSGLLAVPLLSVSGLGVRRGVAMSARENRHPRRAPEPDARCSAGQVIHPGTMGFDRVKAHRCRISHAEVIRHSVSSRSSDTASSRGDMGRMIGPTTRGRRQPPPSGKRDRGAAAILGRVVTSAATTLLAVFVVAGLIGYLWLGRVRDDPLQCADAVIALAGAHDGRESYGLGVARQVSARALVLSDGYPADDPVMRRACAVPEERLRSYAGARSRRPLEGKHCWPAPWRRNGIGSGSSWSVGVIICLARASSSRNVSPIGLAS